MSIRKRHPDERKLSLLASNDLGPMDRWRVHRHVIRCDRCAATVAAHARMRAEMLKEPPPAQPDFSALAHQVHVEVAQATVAAPRRPGWTVPVAGTAVAALILIVLTVPSGIWETDRSAPHPVQTTSVPILAESMDAQVTTAGALSVRSFHSESATLIVTTYHFP